MSTTYPTTKQSIPNPVSTDLLENADATLDHDYQHSTINDTIEALQDKVGIDGSATTTTHDYKLSAVTGSNKALTSGTSTQSVTGLTLVTPTLTLGSDATGDMYYRNGSGVLTRLPAGTDGQIIAYSSGLPTAIANPSASAASQTAAGVIEIATTAEQTTGTDDTRASTPKSVHDMTSLAGAAWFLDEDTMSSDSATKTASQQSIKAYADTKASLNDVPNTSETASTWYTWQMPILTWYTGGPDQEPAGWQENGFAETTAGLGAGYQNITLSNNGGSVSTLLPGALGTSDNDFKFSNGQKWKAKFYAKVDNSTTVWGFGITMTGDVTDIYDVETVATASQMRIVWNSSNTYLVNSNGTNYTANSVSVTRTNWNLYELYFDGTSLYCYVNGTLAATNSTNLPTSSSNGCYLIIGGNTNSNSIFISPITFSLEL